MKKLDYTILSMYLCQKCGRRMKQNLVNKKGPRAVCYKCYTKSKRKGDFYNAEANQQ